MLDAATSRLYTLISGSGATPPRFLFTISVYFFDLVYAKYVFSL